MSFLDNLFQRSADPELVLSGAAISGDATILPGFVYRVTRGASPIDLTLAALTLAERAGKRFAVKVEGVAEVETQDLTVFVPSGSIEDDDGVFGASAVVTQLTGLYREWLCDEDGDWLLITPPPSDGGAGEADALTFAAGDPIPLGTRPTTGQSLSFDGTSIVGADAAGAARYGGSWHDPPRVPHAADEEFDGDELPVAFSAWKKGSPAFGPMVALAGYDTVPPSADISFGVAVAGSTNVKLQVNHPRKPSRLVVQFGAAAHVLYARKIVALAADHVFRARLHGGYVGGIGNFFLQLTRDSGGVPDYSSYVRIGVRANGIVTDFAASGSESLSYQTISPIEGLSYELVIQKTSTGKYLPILQSEFTQYELNPIDFGGAHGMFTGSALWAGLLFDYPGSLPKASVMTGDYLRQQDDGDVF